MGQWFHTSVYFSAIADDRQLWLLKHIARGEWISLCHHNIPTLNRKCFYTCWRLKLPVAQSKLSMLMQDNDKNGTFMWYDLPDVLLSSMPVSPDDFYVTNDLYSETYVDQPPPSQTAILFGNDILQFVKISVFHWTPCKLNLLGNPTCLEWPLFLDISGIFSHNQFLSS